MKRVTIGWIWFVVLSLCLALVSSIWKTQALPLNGVMAIILATVIWLAAAAVTIWVDYVNYTGGFFEATASTNLIVSLIVLSVFGLLALCFTLIMAKVDE